MRQKEDLEFATALNHLGSGNLTEKDIQLFKSRVFKENDYDITNIFRTNEEVDTFNWVFVDKIDSQAVISIGVDTPNVNHTNIHYRTTNAKMTELELLALEKARNLPRNNTKLEYKLILKTSVLYRIIYNIDIQDGLANGTTGTLEKISFNQQNKKPILLWLKFENSQIGQNKRKKSLHLYHLYNVNYTSNLTPIEPRPVTFKIASPEFDSLYINRKQFPVVISQGMTTYASQGSTYKQIAVTPHFKNKWMERSELYVAASR